MTPTWSLSSVWPRSRPLAWAILFPDTRFPTITEAGPISAQGPAAPDHVNNMMATKTQTTLHPPPLPSVFTWLLLPWLGQVGDAGVRAHEHIAGMQPPLQVQLLDLRQVDPPQWGLGESVGRDERQAEHPYTVDAVNGLGGTEGEESDKQGGEHCGDVPRAPRGH